MAILLYFRLPYLSCWGHERCSQGMQVFTTGDGLGFRILLSKDDGGNQRFSLKFQETVFSRLAFILQHRHLTCLSVSLCMVDWLACRSQSVNFSNLFSYKSHFINATNFLLKTTSTATNKLRVFLTRILTTRYSCNFKPPF